MTGCVLTVALSASMGPSAASFHRSSPSTSEASANVSRTILASEKPSSMPTTCEPCPGYISASFTVHSPLDQHRTPGKTATHTRQQHVLSAAYASVPDCFIQRQGDRGSRRVGMTFHCGDYFLHAQAQFPGCRLNDADVG